MPAENPAAGANNSPKTAPENSAAAWIFAGGVILILLIAVSLTVYTYYQNQDTRKYIEENAWYQGCVETLLTATEPLINEYAVTEHCRRLAHHGGALTNQRILSALAYKNPDNKAEIDQYLRREQPIPGCGRNKCEPPPNPP